jgi:hypothetical protein
MLYGRFYQVRRHRGFTEFSEVRHAGKMSTRVMWMIQGFWSWGLYWLYRYVGHADYGGGTGYVNGMGYWAHAGCLTCKLNEAGYHRLSTAKWIVMHAL